jgi:hypothetical protein
MPENHDRAPAGPVCAPQPLVALLFFIGPTIDSAASSRGWLAKKPRAGLHARPGRRTVPSCTRRPGLVAARNVAVGLLARTSHTHTSRVLAAFTPLGQPLRHSLTLSLEIALRSTDRSSRETSKTGLRPVGQAAVAAFETGLRPVKRSATRDVVCDLHARPTRQPVFGCRRRAGLFVTRTFSATRYSSVHFPLDSAQSPARSSVLEQRRGHHGLPSRHHDTQQDSTEPPASTPALFLLFDARILLARTAEQAAGVRPCRALRARPGGTAAGRWAAGRLGRRPACRSFAANPCASSLGRADASASTTVFMAAITDRV